MSSFGEELKRERELRRITLREVAESTKISIRHLEALERNEFDNLPGGVFNRGFVRAYAQFIGIDPDITVTSYLMEEQSRVPEAAPTYGHGGVLRRVPDPVPIAPARLPALGPAGRNLLLAAVAALLLVLLVLAGWMWLARGPEDPPAETSHARPADAPPPESAGPGADGAALAEPPPSEQPAPRSDERPTELPVTPPEPESPPAVPADALLTRIHMLRPTSGRVDCDNTRIEMLDGLRGGTKIEFLCRRYLMIDAEDGGAVQIGIGREEPRALGRDGERISGKRIDVAGLRAAESRP